MRLVDVLLELLVSSECRPTDGALVGQVCGLEGLSVVLCHVVEQLPLVDLAADGTATLVLALVGKVLHGRSHQAVRPQQVTLQALVSEETEVTSLAVQGRTPVQHLSVDSDLVEKIIILIKNHIIMSDKNGNDTDFTLRF